MGHRALLGHSPEMVNSLGVENTILESSSNRQHLCLKQETAYVTSWIGTFNFFYLHSLPSTIPPPFYGRLSYVVFVVSTIEDCIWGVQNVFRVLKKRPRLPFIACWGEGRKKWNVQFYFRPPLTFYFCSTAADRGPFTKTLKTVIFNCSHQTYHSAC